MADLLFPERRAGFAGGRQRRRKLGPPWLVGLAICRAAAQAETVRAALAALGDGSEAAAVPRREYAAREADAADEDVQPSSMADSQGWAVAAQRGRSVGLHDEGTIGDDAFHMIEEELDVIELTAKSLIRTLSAPS